LLSRYVGLPAISVTKLITNIIQANISNRDPREASLVRKSACARAKHFC
jgi:hypothetical protein